MRNTGPRWCGDTVLKCPRLLPKLLPPPLLATLCLALAASPLAQAQDATSMTLHEGPSKTATPTTAPEKPSLEIWAGTPDHQKPAPVPGQTPSVREPVSPAPEVVPEQTPSATESATPALKAEQGTSVKRHTTPATKPEATMEQSTGNVILDKTTTNAFRQWRFKPGTVSKVRVPITYTE